MSSFPPPPPPMGGPPMQPTPPAPPPMSPQPSSGASRILGLPPLGWLGIAVAAIVGIGGFIALSGDDDKNDKTVKPALTSVVATTLPEDSLAPPAETTEPATTEPESTEPGTTKPEATETTVSNAAEEVAGSPAGQRGTRAAPVAAGELADIGGGWRLQVLGVTPDATAQIEAENEFNDPPPAGSTFTIVNVAMGYFGSEDPKAGYEPTVSAIGSTNVELVAGCGSIANELNIFTDVYAGGVLTGNLCFITTPADIEGLQLYATGDYFSSDSEVFLEVAQPAAATPMTGLRGPQDGASSTPARLKATPVGTAADVGAGWSLTLSSTARDITDLVTTENSFNDPPPPGFRFIGVDVIYTFNGDGSDSAFTVTTSAVSDSNVQLSNYCGVIPTPVDDFVDVFAGGSVSGTLCFVTPVDAGTLTLYASASFDIPDVMFATV